MKIKNMKLMLLGLVGLMGASTASAAVTKVGDKQKVDGVMYEVKAASDVKQDENGRSVKYVVYNLYTVKWTAVEGSKSFETKEAYVIGVNASAGNADVATITIPAEVTGDKGTYQVVEIASTWNSALKNVKAVTKTLSLDITNLKAALALDAYKDFSALTSLTIKDASTSETPLTTSFDGSTCAFKASLTTLDLSGSRISAIAADGLMGYTALTGFDFGTNITTIGANAFKGDYGFTTLAIPATVETIGADAFAGMYYKKDATTPAVGLKELTFNANSDAIKGFATIPAVFAGDKLLAKVTITSTKATAFDANAFNDATVLEELDLSGCSELGAINANDFAASTAFKSIKLAGTKIVNINNLVIKNSNKTLAEITLPTTLNTLEDAKFKNFVALTSLDLSETAVKVIPTALCEYHTTEAPSVTGVDGKPIAPALVSVALNPETETIGIWAFAKQGKLATVTGFNQDKLQSIGEHAFDGTALTTLDLSAATNAAFTTIDKYAFGNMAKLATITLPAQINKIYPAAFANAEALTSINLEDLEGLTVLNPIFHEGVVSSSWTSWSSGLYTINATANEVAIPITSLTLPDGLTTINPGALQLLDITEITIPSSVTWISEYALQGCIKLETFEWNDAKSRSIYDTALRGDDHLKTVKMVTNTPGSSISIIKSTYYIDDQSIDRIFKGNKKDVLKFIVNAEDEASFLAAGWTETNLHYCTLTSKEASVYKFKEASKVGEFFYSNYYNADQATWFPAENFEVFGAEVQGSEVVLLPATVEEGYYKVMKAECCIIRSKVQEAEYELKNASFNNISTMPTDDELIWGNNAPASRLSYQYKLGIKGGKVAFYRITTGKINGVYIQAATPKDRLDIVFEGEATGIQSIATEAESNAPIYNLNGVRVQKAGKGIYIQNGKKYVK